MDEWYRTTPARVLLRWQAFADLEPFGPLREDQRAAKVVAWTAAGKGVTLRDEDVFPSLAPPAELREATEEEEDLIRRAYQAGAREG